MENNVTVDLSIRGLTGNQATKVQEFIETLTSEEATEKKTRGRKSKPEPTIKTKGNEDESEEENYEEETTEDEEESEVSEDEETDDDAQAEEDEDDAEPTVSFSKLKSQVDLYGEKKPKEMKVLLASFNIKSTAELKTARSKWDAVYRKIQNTFGKKGK